MGPPREEAGDVGGVGHPVDVRRADARLDRPDRLRVRHPVQIGEHDARAAVAADFEHDKAQRGRLQAAADQPHVRLDVLDEPLARALDRDRRLRFRHGAEGHLLGSEHESAFRPVHEQRGVAREDLLAGGGEVVRLLDFGEEQAAAHPVERFRRGRGGERPRGKPAQQFFVGDPVRVHGGAGGAVARGKFVDEDVLRGQRLFQRADVGADVRAECLSLRSVRIHALSVCIPPEK